MKWLLKDIPSLEEDTGFISDCLAKNVPFSKTSMREHQFGKKYAETVLRFHGLISLAQKGEFSKDEQDLFDSVGEEMDMRLYNTFSFLAQWMFEENGSFFEVGSKLFNQLPDSKKPENAYLNWQFELFRHGTSFQFKFPKYDVLVYYHPSKAKAYGLSTQLSWENIWSNFCIQLPAKLHNAMEPSAAIGAKEGSRIGYLDFLQRMWCNSIGCAALRQHEEMFGKVSLLKRASENNSAYEAYSNTFLNALSEYGRTKQGKQWRAGAIRFERESMQLTKEQIIFVFQSRMLPPKMREEDPKATRLFTVCMTNQKQIGDFIENGFSDFVRDSKAHNLDFKDEQEKKEDLEQNQEIATAMDTILKILAFCSKDEFIEKYKPAPIVQKKKWRKTATIVTPQTKILLPKKIIYYLHSGEVGHGSEKVPHTRKAHWRPIYKKDENRKRLRDEKGNFIIDFFTPVQPSVIHARIYNGPYNPPKTYLIDEESSRLQELLEDRHGASREAISKTIERLNKKNKHQNK